MAVIPPEDGPWNTPPANTDGCPWVDADGVEHRVVVRLYRPNVYGADESGTTYGDSGRTYGDIGVGTEWDDITTESFSVSTQSGDGDGVANADVDSLIVSLVDNVQPFKVPFDLDRTADNLTVGALLQVWHGYDDAGWTWNAISTGRVIRAEVVHEPGVRTVELEAAGLITDLNGQVPESFAAPAETTLARTYRVLNSAGWGWGQDAEFFGDLFPLGYQQIPIPAGTFGGTWRELLDLVMVSGGRQYTTDVFGRIKYTPWPYAQTAVDGELLVTDCEPNQDGAVSHSMVVRDGNDQLLNRALVSRAEVTNANDVVVSTLYEYTATDPESVGTFGLSDSTFGYPKTDLLTEDANNVQFIADGAVARYGRTATFVAVFQLDGRLTTNNLRLIGAPELAEGYRVLVRRPDGGKMPVESFEKAYNFTNGPGNPTVAGAAVLDGDLYLNKIEADGANIGTELLEVGAVRGGRIEDAFGDFVFNVEGSLDLGTHVQFFGTYTGTPPADGRRFLTGFAQPGVDMVAHVCGSEITLEPRGRHFANIYLTPLTQNTI